MLRLTSGLVTCPFRLGLDVSFASWISLEDLLGLLASLCWNLTSFFGFVMVCGRSQYSDWDRMDGSLRQLERDFQRDGWAGRGRAERGWKDRFAWIREGERTGPDDQTTRSRKKWMSGSSANKKVGRVGLGSGRQARPNSNLVRMRSSKCRQRGLAACECPMRLPPA